MRKRTERGWLFGLGLLLGGTIALAILVVLVFLQARPDSAGSFASAVDLSPLDRAAVFHRGRIKSFQSFAEEVVAQIAGREGIHVPAPTASKPEATTRIPADFAYLDLMIRPERYEGRPIIFVPNKPMRATLAARLVVAGEMDHPQANAFIDRGLISIEKLMSSAAGEVIDGWARDLVRTAKFVDQLENAVTLANWQTLRDILRVIPPPTGDPQTPWMSVNDLWAGGDGGPTTPAEVLALQIDPGARDSMQAAWARFVEAWRTENAPAANAALADFARPIPGIAPKLYPSKLRLTVEAWYFEAHSLVWGWVIFLCAVVVLLMAVLFRWSSARWMGMGIFAAAVGVQTASLGLRWFISGRWPNSNMFEAVMTSVWFGAIVAIVLEFVARRTPLRNLFAVGAGVASMAAMMAAQFAPRLDASINNVMPILHDIWLYIHTNVIIASYALIAMAAVTAVLYLARRMVVGGKNWALDYAKAGGMGALLGSESDPGGDAAHRKVTLGEVFDGATLVLMELSFILLWSGIVMGAIWADHSWGRPWGWDPKEVFALNTFIVFVVLIHVRLRVRDKGLWTAILAVIGCGVMLFNWIVINFVISGLHSYA